ncbi:reverse transcriptase domain-containing protein [Tanacetum coccineum]
MSAARQEMSFAKIEQVVVQRVAKAIEALRSTRQKSAWLTTRWIRSYNVARGYTTRANEKKAYAGNLPYYNKCKLHHVRSCTMKCGKCKRVGHMARDYKAPVAATNQRAPMANYKAAVICYECGNQWHYKSECPKLKNQNRVNQIRKGKARGNSNVIKDKADA